MEIPLIDRSNYLKGLFITAKLDKQLSNKEKEILKNISDKLGFAKDFYDETIRGLLSNKYLTEEPIIFSDRAIAETFLRDAIRLIFCDGSDTKNELEWLRKTAAANLIGDEFLNKEISQYLDKKKIAVPNDFALFSII